MNLWVEESVRRFQQVLDDVSCSWQLVMSRDGPVLTVNFTLFRRQSCQVLSRFAELLPSAIWAGLWTQLTGGDLVGHNGEKFAIVLRGSPSLPLILKNEMDRLRIHRKHCLRTRAATIFGDVSTCWCSLTHLAMSDMSPAVSSGFHIWCQLMLLLTRGFTFGVNWWTENASLDVCQSRQATTELPEHASFVPRLSCGVSRARTSCLCAEAVAEQSCFPSLVCETSRRLFRIWSRVPQCFQSHSSCKNVSSRIVPFHVSVSSSWMLCGRNLMTFLCCLRQRKVMETWICLDREGHLDLALMETLKCLDLGDPQFWTCRWRHEFCQTWKCHLDWETLVKKQTCWDFTELHNSEVSMNRIWTVMNHSVSRWWNAWRTLFPWNNQFDWKYKAYGSQRWPLHGYEPKRNLPCLWTRRQWLSLSSMHSVQPSGTSKLLYSIWNGRRRTSSLRWGEKSTNWVLPASQDHTPNCRRSGKVSNSKCWNRWEGSRSFSSLCGQGRSGVGTLYGPKNVERHAKRWMRMTTTKKLKTMLERSKTRLIDLLTQKLAKSERCWRQTWLWVSWGRRWGHVTRQSCSVTTSVSPSSHTKTRTAHIIKVDWWSRLWKKLKMDHVLWPSLLW